MMDKVLIKDLSRKASEDIDNVLKRVLSLVPDDNIEDTAYGIISILGSVTVRLLDDYMDMVCVASLHKDSRELSPKTYMIAVEHHLAELGKVLMAGHSIQQERARKKPKDLTGR